MRLNQISDFKDSKKKRKRVGRGVGSGLGKTCGSGQKGQKSRSGVAIGGFEGGQMPLYRRLPKRGFTVIKAKKNYVNLGDLQNLIDKEKINSSTCINLAILKEASIISSCAKEIKVLAKGVLKDPITIETKSISLAARAKIESLGGKIIDIK